MQGFFRQPIVAKRNKRDCNNRTHTQCTNTSSHNRFHKGFSLQVDTVTVNLQICSTGRHRRHSTGDTLFGHNIFGVCTFPRWPFSFFVTSHKTAPPPPPRGTRTPQVAPRLYPSLLRNAIQRCVPHSWRRGVTRVWRRGVTRVSLVPPLRRTCVLECSMAALTSPSPTSHRRAEE